MKICVIQRLIRSKSISVKVCRREHETGRSVNTDEGVFGEVLPLEAWTGPLSDLSPSLVAGTCTTLALMPD